MTRKDRLNVFIKFLPTLFEPFLFTQLSHQLWLSQALHGQLPEHLAQEPAASSLPIVQAQRQSQVGGVFNRNAREFIRGGERTKSLQQRIAVARICSMEAVFASSAFRHGYTKQDFYELLAADYLKVRSPRGLDEVYELLGRNLSGAYLHVVYRVLPDRRLRVFHMNGMTEAQKRRYRRYRK